MTAIAHEPATRSLVPSAATIFLSGAAGTIAFDIWGQAIAPILGIGALAPEGLARGTLGRLGLPNGASQGALMHLLIVGLIAYPLGWLAVFRPIQRRVAPGLPWAVAAAAYGVGLWIVAIGGVAWFATGNPFLGFARITWNALAGHVLYAFAAAATAEWLLRRA